MTEVMACDFQVYVVRAFASSSWLAPWDHSGDVSSGVVRCCHACRSEELNLFSSSQQEVSRPARRHVNESSWKWLLSHDLAFPLLQPLADILTPMDNTGNVK